LVSDIEDLKKQMADEKRRSHNENENVHKRLNGITRALGEVSGTSRSTEETVNRILDTLLKRKQ